MPDDWIGVDFDGTLAEQTETLDGSIGKPVPTDSDIFRKIKQHLNRGDKVKIFTARAGHKESEENIKKFCKKHFGCELEITDKKDHALREFYDDRAKQVERNTGRVIK